MKKFYCACLLFLLVIPAWGQEIPLQFDGDTETVVRKFPLTVFAPEGADLYFWSYSQGVQAQEKMGTVVIVSAPKGRFTVFLKTIRIDWDAKKVNQQYGQKSFVVGDLPPDPGPEPGPNPNPNPPDPLPPDDKIVSALKTAIAKDGAKITLPQLRETIGKLAEDMGPEYKTNDQVLSVLRASMFGVCKVKNGPPELNNVRAVIEQSVLEIMPGQVGSPLSEEKRLHIRTRLQQIHSALGKI